MIKKFVLVKIVVTEDNPKFKTVVETWEVWKITFSLNLDASFLLLQFLLGYIHYRGGFHSDNSN
jgi:hypothetical protein